jgi:hypothetical protein
MTDNDARSEETNATLCKANVWRQLISEREQAIASLHSACEDQGDNNWSEKLNLSDIIDKHLMQ